MVEDSRTKSSKNIFRKSEPMSTSLLRFTKINVGLNRTLSLSISSLGPKGKKPGKRGGKAAGGKAVTVEPPKAETVSRNIPPN